MEATLATRRLSPSSASAKNPGAPSAPSHQYRSRMSPRRDSASCVEGDGLALLAEVPKHLGQLAPRAVRVPLHFHHRDRTDGQRAVGELDRVLGVLPALVAERAGPPGAVLEQTIAVGISGPPHPGQRRPRRRQQPLDGRARRPPPKRRAEKDEKERGRVDRPEVRSGTGARAVTEPRTGCEPDLVQDLPGLLLVAGIAHAPLASCERTQRVEHLGGEEGARLVACHDAVATEEGDEPGDAGRDQAPVGVHAVGEREGVQVGERAPARAGKVRGIAAHLDLTVFAGRDPLCGGWFGGGVVAGHDDVQMPWGPSPEARRPPGLGTAARIRRRAEADGGGQPRLSVGEPHAVWHGFRAHMGRDGRRTGFQSADLEDVREVRAHLDAHGDLARRLGPPGQDELVLEHPRGDAPAPVHLERSIRIPMRGGDDPVKARGAGREERGAERANRAAVDVNRQPGQVAGVVGDQPVEAIADVAARV